MYISVRIGHYFSYFPFLFFVLTMSVPRSMQRMVMVPRGRGILTIMKNRKGVISGMLLVRVYAMDFFKLSKISRPAWGEMDFHMLFDNISPALQFTCLLLSYLLLLQ